ncbi:MAG: DUF192 domain-containing protein [Candidatus Aenigmarchaeota archaeon]|nr:DUF192 domain-containing protein [Candidatus Aenigmarchaeota archaeon]
MKLKIRLNTIFLLPIFLLLLLFTTLVLRYTKEKYEKRKLLIVGRQITVEVADTPSKIVKGLIGRSSIRDDEGMLFLFKKPGRYGFWMMNMSFPIDIIWIDETKTIVGFVKNAQPCKLNCTIYRPPKPITYVLEVNANFTERYGVKVGDKVEF